MLVRVTAVSGVCHVLSLYFEMIPFPAIKTLLGRLVKELAWDAAAIDVRVAVLQVRCDPQYFRNTVNLLSTKNNLEVLTLYTK